MDVSNATAWFAVGLGRMLYIVDPRSNTFERLEDVPDYVTEAVPFFLMSIFLESVLMFFSDELRPARLNDGIGSVSAGLFQQFFNKIVLKSLEIEAFIWCHDRFNVYNMPTDSLLTWVVAMLLVDLGYYWFHRMSHEVNIIWSAHVVHHSSEEYNQTTALRQSVLQMYSSWIFYMPFALVLPPSVFFVHRQFNTLYQYWIHTEVIGKLGPVEWIMNTPSHHRVHHGRNPYCIDKNYGGTLIIWDRLFGTFVEEKDDERVVYGITHPIDTFDPITIQTHYLVHIFRTAAATPGFMNKVWVFLKGPGWLPGKPRLGNIEDIPMVTYPEKVYDPKIATSLNIYVVIHFAITLFVYLSTLAGKDPIGSVATAVVFAYLLLALTCFGALFDRRSWGAPLEAVRVSAAAALSYFILTGDIEIKLSLLEKLGIVTEALQVSVVLHLLSLLFIIARSVFASSFYGPEGPTHKANPKAKPLAKAAKAAKKD